MKLRKENARLNVRNTQAILNAASAVTALLNARRNPYGENVQLNAKSLQAILTAVRRPVLLNVPTGAGKSAVLAEWQNVTAFQAAVQRSLMWCLGLVFTCRMRVSDQ